MKLKKLYSHNNKRQIFRILPTDTEKIVIEERDVENKQAYFNCLHIDSGKKIFKNLQLPEKFWLGIESIYKDVIYFHKFVKPDLPQHNGIMAFELNEKKILWEDNSRNFLFIKDDVLYTYLQGFESRKYAILNRLNGEVINELGNDSDSINKLKDELTALQDFGNYHFPNFYNSSSIDNHDISKVLNHLKMETKITGQIEYVNIDRLLLFNYHTSNKENLLKNIFKAIDLSDGNCIFEITLNSRINSFAPDSFFVRNDLLFLLIERSKLGVYRIIK